MHAVHTLNLRYPLNITLSESVIYPPNSTTYLPPSSSAASLPFKNEHALTVRVPWSRPAECAAPHPREGVGGSHLIRPKRTPCLPPSTAQPSCKNTHGPRVWCEVCVCVFVCVFVTDRAALILRIPVAACRVSGGHLRVRGRVGGGELLRGCCLRRGGWGRPNSSSARPQRLWPRAIASKNPRLLAPL